MRPSRGLLKNGKRLIAPRNSYLTTYETEAIYYMQAIRSA